MASKEAHTIRAFFGGESMQFIADNCFRGDVAQVESIIRAYCIGVSDARKELGDGK